MTNKKKFNELLENKDFMQEIINMETLEEVQGGFAKQGVEVSKDEVEQLGEVIEEVNEKLSKLSDDELNSIVGGVVGGDLLTSFNHPAFIGLKDLKEKYGEGAAEELKELQAHLAEEVEVDETPGNGLSGKAIAGIIGVSALAATGVGFGIHAWWKKRHH